MTSATTTSVETTVRNFLDVAGKLPDEFGPDTPLFEGGAGLDSLETAELSALLEDEFGSDPYSEGELPQTVGEILGFYAG